MSYRIPLIVACALVSDSSSLAGQQAEMIPLGDLPGGVFFSSVIDVNADGTVAVGAAFSENGNEAMRWEEGKGMIGLGALEPTAFFSRAMGVSADGSTVVGETDLDGSSGGSRGFVWREATGLVPLINTANPNTYHFSQARSASGDGNVVVGWGRVGSNTRPMRYDVETDSYSVFSGGYTFAYDVSADGSVAPVAGGSTGAVFVNGVAMVIGDRQLATAVSADGSVAVGAWDQNSGNHRAFLWDIATGSLTVIPTIPGSDPILDRAVDVSADGSVVIGEISGGINTIDFLWTPEDGTRPLVDTMINEYGLDAQGYTDFRILCVSDDGLTFGGQARNLNGDQEAVLIRLSPSGLCTGDCDDSGDVDFNDLVAMLFEFGNTDAGACDADASGGVDFNDLVAALFLFGPCAS